MLSLKRLVGCLALVFAAFGTSPLIASGPDTANSRSDNQELAEMFAADQEARSRLLGFFKSRHQGVLELPVEAIKAMNEGDAKRLARTEQLFSEGSLHTANDYYHAAFIFQHGSDPTSYLRAHHAAMVSIKLGHPKAPWIAAASLDRYLLSVGQDQIYGTQSSIEDGEAKRENLDIVIFNDRERAKLGVSIPAASE